MKHQKSCAQMCQGWCKCAKVFSARATRKAGTEGTCNARKCKRMTWQRHVCICCGDYSISESRVFMVGGGILTRGPRVANKFWQSILLRRTHTTEQDDMDYKLKRFGTISGKTTFAVYARPSPSQRQHVHSMPIHTNQLCFNIAFFRSI